MQEQAKETEPQLEPGDKHVTVILKKKGSAELLHSEEVSISDIVVAGKVISQWANGLMSKKLVDTKKPDDAKKD